MLPLCLRGHERPITRVLYNKEGDLLFTASMDTQISVWYSTNGERLGSYTSPKGAMVDIDVSWDSKHLIAASAGSKCYLWDVEKGTELGDFTVGGIVRACSFSYSGNIIAYATDGKMDVGKSSWIFVRDLRMPDIIWSSKTGTPDSVIRQLIWGTLEEFLVTAHVDGTVSQWNSKTGSQLIQKKVHNNTITDLQTDPNMMFVLTSSKDNCAKLLDIETLDILKTYKTERPVNSASISPKQDHVMLGGGQEASDVTKTAVDVGMFDSRLFHLIFEEEIGRIKGHFGPVNSLAFHPEGLGFSSGGEDGLVLLYEFDDEYIEGDLKHD